MAAAMDYVARFGQKCFARGRVRASMAVGLGLVALTLSACGRPWQLTRSNVEASLAPGEPSKSSKAKSGSAALAAARNDKPAAGAEGSRVGARLDSAGKSPEASAIESLTRTLDTNAEPATEAHATGVHETPAIVASTTWQPDEKKGDAARDDRGKKPSPTPAPADSDLLSDALVVAQTMNIQEVLKYAVENHPLLKSRKHEVEVAEAKLIAAGIFPNPQLVISTDTPTQQAGPTELETRLMFTIPLGGKLDFASHVADAGIMRAQLALSNETEKILFEAADAAVEVLYLQEAVKIEREQVRVIGEFAKYIEGLEEAKGRINTIIARVNVAELEQREFNALALLTVARLRLSRAIGLESPRLVEMTGGLSDEPLPALSLERILAVVRETRPEIAQSRAAVEEARRQIGLAYAEAIPDLSLGPRYQDRFRSPTDSMGARINFDLPLFDRNQGGIAESLAQLRVNQANVRVTELKSINDVAAAFVELAPLPRQIAHYKRNIKPLREEMLKVIRDFVDVGQLTAPQAINEIQKLAKLAEEDLKLRYQYNQLKVKLELFLGRPLRTFADPERGPATPPTEPKRPKFELPKQDPFKDEPPLEEMPALPKRASDETPREPRPFPPAMAGPEMVTPAVHEVPAGISFPPRLQATVEPPAQSDSLPDAEPLPDDSPAEEPAANSATMDP